MRLRILLETIIALFVFALAYTLIRIALSEIPPLSVAALRFILASGVMIPFALARNRATTQRPTRKEVPVFLGLAIAQIVIPNVFQNIGLEYTTASVTSVLQSTTPVFTLLLSFMLLKERIDLRDVTGLGVAIFGVTMLSTGGDVRSLAGSVFLGNVLQVGVAASYAVAGIVGKVLLRKYSPLYVVTVCFVGGGLLLTIFSVVFERGSWPQTMSTTVVLSLLLLSLLYCAALVSWYDVLQQTKVFRLYVLLFGMPVLAIVISVLVLGESFTLSDIFFSAVTLLGVGITQYGKQR